MSSHYVACAAESDLPASKKLVLMACADSADTYTRVGMPGLEHVQQWAGVGRARALGILKELITAGLLVRTASAHRGRRAEYMVFPGGCCAAHGPMAGHEPIGSGPADSKPADEPQENGSSPVDPLEKGSNKGSNSYWTPSKLLSALPPNPPPASRPGGGRSGCNPDPDKPTHPNCRTCRTTPRTQVADTTRRAKLAHRAAIDDCDRCDHNGQVEENTGRQRRCDHGQAATA